jgi:indole-3-glycerol phosphate synthase
MGISMRALPLQAHRKDAKIAHCRKPTHPNTQERAQCGHPSGAPLLSGRGDVKCGKDLAMSPAQPVLERILVAKRREVEEARAVLPLADVKEQAKDAPPARDLYVALRPERSEGGVHRVPVQLTPPPRPRIIAEIKRRSPTAGEIRPRANAVEIAQQYMLAGAAAISVLTDVEFFGGSMIDLVAVRAGTPLPILRKDFVIDPYMVWRSRAAGADAVLLIVAAVERDELVELSELTAELKMAALIEVHSEKELEQAMMLDPTPRIVGINHRNLHTFEMDMTLSARLRKQLPAEVAVVAESGIQTADDMRQMGEAGCDAVLVGETLMRAADPGQALRELLRGCS